MTERPATALDNLPPHERSIFTIGLGWIERSPLQAAILLSIAALIFCLLSWGGILRMEPLPSWWRLLIIGLLFLAAAAALIWWYWDHAVRNLIVAAGFALVWDLLFQFTSSEVGIGAWAFLWYALYYACQRVSTIAAFLGLVGPLAIHSLLLLWLSPWPQEHLLISLTINIAIGSFVIYLGSRRRYVDTLLDRNRLLVQQRDQRAELAVADERNRIAREMHDIVSHSLAVMVSLSDGAARLAETDPAAAAEAMAGVAQVGRDAVADMRRLLTFLRSEAELHPQPGIDDLGDLIAQYRNSGLPIEVELTTELPDNPALGLTIYRIVQEALTNVLRHAPRCRQALIRITQTQVGEYEIIVDNSPSSGAEPANPGAGQGLLGMKERVSVFNGSLSAGPRSGGGWRVRATLKAGAQPVRSAPTPVHPANGPASSDD